MRNITIDEFKNFTYPSNLTYKNNKLFFTETSVNMEKNRYETNISYYNLNSKEKINLTNSKEDGNFIILSNGKVLFTSTKDRKKDDLGTYFYQIDPKGGERKFLFKTELLVFHFEEIDEDNILIIGSESKKPSKYEEIDILPFWLNNVGFIQNLHTKAYIYNVKEEKEELILGDDISLNTFKLNEDKSKALVIFGKDEKVMPLEESIGLFDMEYKTLEIIDEGMSYYFVDFLSDGIIFIGNDMKTYGINQDAKVYFNKGKAGTSREISKKDFDISFGNSTGTDLRQGDGQSFITYNDELYYISTEFDHAVLSKIDKNGNITKMDHKKGSIECFDINKENGQIYIIAMRDLKIPEIYILNGDEEIQISNYSEKLKDIKLSPIEEFDFTNDGIDFKGYVMKPIDYEEGKKYPGVLEIHGGPKTVFSNIIHHEMQYLSSLGYFVFYTNPRGSSSRGVEFSDIRGKYGSIDYDDLMVFTDEVLRRYKDIDKDNLAVMGGSYGGFMTNWVIGHTDRFKVANSQRSISNWTSFYGVSDIGYYFAQDQTDSNPWDNLDKMWDQSPLKYARNVKTPTLFIHSDQDYRCPLEQGIQMYAAVKLNNVDSKIVIFHNENHELSRSGKPEARVKRLKEIVDFYSKHIEK